MKKIVADSTALILLSKCNLLRILCTRFEVIVPLSVIDETASEELSRKYPDASAIRDLFSQGFFKIERPGSGQFQIPLKLHRGEEDSLRVAQKLSNVVYATDDGKAIKAARFLEIPFIITPKLVVDLYKLEEISFDKARQSIEKLGKIGRYSPVIIAEAILSLAEARDEQAHNDKNT